MKAFDTISNTRMVVGPVSLFSPMLKRPAEPTLAQARRTSATPTATPPPAPPAVHAPRALDGACFKEKSVQHGTMGERAIKRQPDRLREWGYVNGYRV